jgi:hypothetical protein
MSWFYNSYSGELTHASGVDALAYEAALHSGTGWHELNISDSATEAQAAAEAKKEDPSGTTPTTSVSKGITSAVTNNPVTNAVGKLGGYALSFGNTTGLLTRILKITLGGILIIAGIMRISGADKDLVQIAGTAAKGAVLA